MKKLDNNELVILDPLDQDSAEWLEWRNKGIGSSDVAVLMSPVPVFDRTVGTLWKQKVGYERAVQVNNPHVKRGKDLEPVIRDMCNKVLGAKFEPVCLYRKDSSYLRASLDGFDPQLDALLEIKAPSANVFKKYLKGWEASVAQLGYVDAKTVIPKNYYEQMQYQMLVSDVECAYFSFYNEEIPRPFLILVENDIETQLEIEKRCHLFWKSVQTKVPLGWMDGELKLFHQRPTLILISCTGKQFEHMAFRQFELPVVNPTAANRGSGIGFLVEGSKYTLPSIRMAHPDHDVKIINLAPSHYGMDEVPIHNIDRLIRQSVSS